MEQENITKNKQLDMSEYKLVYNVPNIPLQNNYYDCGVFACKYADYIARRDPITFTQVCIAIFHLLVSLPISNR